MSGKFGIVYKLFAFMLIISIVLAALSVCALYPTLRTFFTQVDELELTSAAADYVKTIFGSSPEGLTEAYDNLAAKWDQFSDILYTNSTMINLAVFLCAVIYVLFIVFLMWGLYSVSDVINHGMSSNSKFGFASNLVYNFVKAMRFAFLYALCSLAFYAVGVLLIWAAFVSVFAVSAYLGCMVFCLIVFFMLALRSSLFACWIPAMTEGGEGAVSGLKISLRIAKKRFGKLFSMYFAYYIAVFSFAVIFGLVTFGIGFLLIVAASLVHAQVINLVFYYRYNGKRYYIDVLNVVDPSIKQRSL